MDIGKIMALVDKAAAGDRAAAGELSALMGGKACLAIKDGVLDRESTKSAIETIIEYGVSLPTYDGVPLQPATFFLPKRRGLPCCPVTEQPLDPVRLTSPVGADWSATHPAKGNGMAAALAECLVSPRDGEQRPDVPGWVRVDSVRAARELAAGTEYWALQVAAYWHAMGPAARERAEKRCFLSPVAPAEAPAPRQVATDSRPVARTVRDRLTFMTDSDFMAICLDQFPHVHRRFSGGMDKTSKINLLLQLVTADDVRRALEG